MRISIALSFIILASACAKDERPAVYPVVVEGAVTFEGKPLETGTIAFIPEVPEELGSKPGIARIEDGAYYVGNANPEKPAGLKPGRYRVTILSMSIQPTPKGARADLITPDVYAEAATTPLEVDLAAGERTLNFNLKR